MKKITQILNFGVLLLFVCTLQLSAQDCTFSKDETDKFSGDRVLHTKPVNLIEKTIKQKGVFTIKKIEMQVKYENSSSILALALHFDMGVFASTNSKLIFILANGNKIELPCLRTLFSQKMGGMPVQTHDFELNEENFKELLKSDIIDVRFDYSRNAFDFTVSSKVKTSELFNCINNNK